MEAFNGKGRFSRVRRLKTLDRSIPNFEQITTVLTSCYKPTFITIAPRSSSAQYGEVAQIFLFASFFHFLSRPRQGSAFWGLVKLNFR
jgi:hypothetical protein